MNRVPRGLVILGFGGHARSVADVALAAGVERLLFVDDNARDSESFLGHPVRRELPSAGDYPGWMCFPASGNNATRHAQVDRVRAHGWELATLIAPSATVGVGSSLGRACVIGHHAHVGPLATVGEGTIVNTGAIVEHDCRVGKYVHISVNTTLAGRVSIGDFAFIGAGATVLDGIEVCAGTTVGSGAVVVRNVAAAGVIAGIPAKPLRGG